MINSLPSVENTVEELLKKYKGISFGIGQNFEVEVNLSNATFSAAGVINKNFPGLDPKQIIFQLGRPYENSHASDPNFPHYPPEQNGPDDPMRFEGLSLFPSQVCIEDYLTLQLADQCRNPVEIENRINRMVSNCYHSTLYSNLRVLIPAELMRLVKLTKISLRGFKYFLYIEPYQGLKPEFMDVPEN